jgi:hypothetical protein
VEVVVNILDGIACRRLCLRPDFVDAENVEMMVRVGDLGGLEGVLGVH